MTLQTPLVRWTLSLLVLVTTATTSWAGPKHVPFKASVATQEALGIDPVRCPGTFLTGTTTGQGTASHMGAVRLSASDCPTTADGVNFFFSNGELTLTGANGDTLQARYQGTLLPIAGSSPVLHAISGTFHVSGGTGRFRGARGGGNLQGTQDLVTLKGLYRVDGRLSYGDGSDRD